MTEHVDIERVAAALPGHELGGHELGGHELGGELGRGGFGVVLAGRHRLIDLIVAVKVLLDPGGAGDADGADSVALPWARAGRRQPTRASEAPSPRELAYVRR